MSTTQRRVRLDAIVRRLKALPGHFIASANALFLPGQDGHAQVVAFFHDKGAAPEARTFITHAVDDLQFLLMTVSELEHERKALEAQLASERTRAKQVDEAAKVIMAGKLTYEAIIAAKDAELAEVRDRCESAEKDAAAYRVALTIALLSADGEARTEIERLMQRAKAGKMAAEAAAENQAWRKWWEKYVEVLKIHGFEKPKIEG